MDEQRRREVLKRGKPDRVYPGQPGHGGWHTEEDIDAVVTAMREAMDWHVGFLTYNRGLRPEIFDFEDAFANYCGTEFCCIVNAAGTGLDLEPGDEVIVPAISFVAQPLSVIGQGGKVVWCEVDPRTLQADPEDVEKIGSREGGLMMIYGLYPGVPLANVKALMDTMEQYAGYCS